MLHGRLGFFILLLALCQFRRGDQLAFVTGEVEHFQHFGITRPQGEQPRGVSHGLRGQLMLLTPAPQRQLTLGTVAIDRTQLTVLRKQLVLGTLFKSGVDGHPLIVVTQLVPPASEPAQNRGPRATLPRSVGPARPGRRISAAIALCTHCAAGGAVVEDFAESTVAVAASALAAASHD